ncbi:NYN domain-containing protein [Aliigemmobacter aestuarii]|nr:NYN domain-containing protein [Gemmobacter aestuarii]
MCEAFTDFDLVTSEASMTSARRIAVFVDADNISADHLELCRKTANELGNLVCFRVVGSPESVKGWLKPGVRAICHAAGKNSADIVLSLEALELALTRQADAFVFATSDRDLSICATRLRELGFDVTCLGEKTKVALETQQSYAKFIAVPVKRSPATATTAKKTAANVPNEAFKKKISQFLVDEAKQPDGPAINGGWIPLSVLGQSRAREKGISKVAAGVGKNKSWRTYFEGNSSSFEIDEGGQKVRPRSKAR